MLMPSHAKVVQPYRDTVQIFARNGIEAQLDRMLQPQVNLKSGGYIIINQTEALVAIDVNSGRSTKEHSIEDTALQTNLEAADEVARQLRLRDLAGLIVVDFIDMEENRNNRAVEKRMKDALKNDRARIQVGRISHFGLLEMSRQRMRASVLESTTQTCPHCGGTGHVRSDSSVGLHVIRGIEEYLLKDNRSHITVRTPVSTALYVLNHKRSTLVEMEKRFGVTISFETDETLGTQHYVVTKGAAVENPVIIAPPSFEPVVDDLDDEPMQPFDEDAEDEIVEHEAESREEAEPKDSEGESERDRKRRRRRRRRGGRDRDAEHVVTPAVTGDHGLASNADEAPASDEDPEVGAEPVEPDAESESDQKKRRRGKRGGRRNRREDGETAEADAEDVTILPGDDAEHSAFTGATAEAVAGIDPEGEVQSTSDNEPSAEGEVQASALVAETPSSELTEASPAEEAPAPAKRPRARRTKKAIAAEQAAAAEQADAAVATEVVEANAIGDAPAPEAPVVQEEAPATPQQEPVLPEAQEEPAAAAPQEAADEPERPSRRRATASDTPAEPVVTSTGAPESAVEEKAAPRKGGWWQRKSFF
jgi:ribonuclease E